MTTSEDEQQDEIGTVIHQESGKLFWATCLIKDCEFLRPYDTNDLAVEALDQHHEDAHEISCR